MWSIYCWYVWKIDLGHTYYYHLTLSLKLGVTLVEEGGQRHGVVVDLGGGHPMSGRVAWLCRRVAFGEDGHVGCFWVAGERIARLHADVSNGGTDGCRLPRCGCRCGALEPPFEILQVKTWFGYPDGRWWRSCVVFSLKASSWRPPIMSGWWSVWAVVVIVVLGCFSLSKALWWWLLELGQIGKFRPASRM
jgi:hypothetical protein